MVIICFYLEKLHAKVKTPLSGTYQLPNCRDPDRSGSAQSLDSEAAEKCGVDFSSLRLRVHLAVFAE